VPEFRFNWYIVTGGEAMAEFIPAQPNAVPARLTTDTMPTSAPLIQPAAILTLKVKGPKASTSAAPASTLSSTLSPPIQYHPL